MARLFYRIVNYDDPNSLVSRLRARRSSHVKALIESSFSRKRCCNILDVGGTARYWSIFSEEYLQDRNVFITLLNRRKQPLPDGKKVFRSTVGDARDLSMFGTGEFDLVHSNSVIEHVGMWRDMEQAASEIRRVGHAYYVQTPYFWFPIEPHYFFPLLHWMPLPWRARIAMWKPLGNWPKAPNFAEAVAAQQAAILLDARMMRALFPDSILLFERFFGFRKSVICYRDVQVTCGSVPADLGHLARLSDPPNQAHP